MDIHIQIPEKIDIDNFMLQKMVFLYNALERGWDVKKVEDKYIFTKNKYSCIDQAVRTHCRFSDIYN